jgi:hypothetical protein
MNNKFLKMAFASMVLSASNIANAGVIPFGVQTNVSSATVDQWGWSECYSEVASNGGANLSVSTINSSCNGTYTMMGLFNSNNNQYEVLAAGETANVFMDTPGIYSTIVNDGFNKSNGVNWYLYDNPNSIYGAWGFFSENTYVRPTHCDYQDIGNPDKSSLCMHMQDLDGFGDGNPSDDYISDVYTFFDQGVQTYGGSSNFQVVFLSQSIPEPSTLAIFALSLMGLASRRFKKS